MMQQKIWRKFVKSASLISLLTSTRRFNQHLYLLVLGWKVQWISLSNRWKIHFGSYRLLFVLSRSIHFTRGHFTWSHHSVYRCIGFPGEMVSDNEKQFFSGGFKAFLKCCGIEHVCVSPYCARSNGKSVRFHRYVKENFRVAISAAKS